MKLVKKRHEKVSTVYKDLRFLQYYNYGSFEGTLEMQSCCVPYLHLRELYEAPVNASYSTHKPSTLLQHIYAGADPLQDQRQAVCSGSNDGSKRCLHVSQLWAVVINNGEPASTLTFVTLYVS